MWISNPNHSFCYRYSVRCRGVQGCALSSQIGLKIRRPQGRGGSIPPPGTRKIKQFLPPVGLRQSGSHPLVGSGYWIAEVEVIRLQPTVRDGMKSVRYRGFMVWRMPRYSAPRESLEILLVGRRIGMMHIVCYLRNKNRGSLNILEDDARG
jgi:hypothetical protein